MTLRGVIAAPTSMALPRWPETHLAVVIVALVLSPARVARAEAEGARAALGAGVAIPVLNHALYGPGVIAQGGADLPLGAGERAPRPLHRPSRPSRRPRRSSAEPPRPAPRATTRTPWLSTVSSSAATPVRPKRGRHARSSPACCSTRARARQRSTTTIATSQIPRRRSRKRPCSGGRWPTSVSGA